MDTTNTLSIDLDAIARQFQLGTQQVQAAVELLDEGNTVPFITRYRKDRTGGLDEEKIRLIQDAVNRWRQVNERKERVLRSIEAQGRLTEELGQRIHAATSLKTLDDLYLPYRPKKQTLATLARQRGLEPLALEVLNGDWPTEELASRVEALVDPDKGLSHEADVLNGVRHILAEIMSERVDLRSLVRKCLWHGILSSKRTERTDGDELTNRNDDIAAAETVPLEAGPADGTSTEPAPSPEDHSAPSAAAAEAKQKAADGSGADDTPATFPELTTATSPTAKVPSDVSADEAEESTTSFQPELVPVDSRPNAAADDSNPGSDEAVEAPSDSPATDAASPKKSPSPAEIKASAEAAVVARQAAAAERRRERREARHRKRHKLEQSFKDYFDYAEPLKKLPHYRMLAINRGERCKVLRVRVQVDQAQLKTSAETLVVPADHPHSELFSEALHESLVRLVIPSIEREIRRELTDRAEAHAVQVFAQNLRKLLLQPPLRGHRVLAADPGFRSGCKLVALDEFGNVLSHSLIHVIGPEERVGQSRASLAEAIQTNGISVVAIGNGTACRETEQLVAGVLANELADHDVHYLIVNEAGASVYSTSQTGREELPRFDATVRGSVSIGRRALDPLSELVKIDPASIGVGLYQHDVKAKHLRSSLDAVVESCVNYVGVDLNSASPALLGYVSGLNQLTARRVYEYRRQNGPFRRREQLMDVPGIGEATYVQAAGFLKIADGDNPLDATSIHPESYEIADRVLKQIECNLAQLTDALTKRNPKSSPAADGCTIEPTSHAKPIDAGLPNETTSTPDRAALETTEAVVGDPPKDASSERDSDVSELVGRLQKLDVTALAESLGVGVLSLKDILDVLARPGRDPREDLLPPLFRREVLKLEDLKAGMELSGTVLNVVDFGAFVDIGLSDSGLIHVSRLADRFVSDPHEVVSVGDILNVWVVDVDEKRRRVSLTAIEPGSESARPARRGRDSGRQGGGQKRHKPRPDGGQQGAGPGRGHANRGSKSKRPQGTKPSRGKPKPKRVVPITNEMTDGNEPMRTFSDLQQFFDQKRPKKRDRDN